MSGVNKNVFSAVLKLSKDGELRTEHGNRFHAADPATSNALLLLLLRDSGRITVGPEAAWPT